MIEDPCPSCSGSGRVTRERALSVNIPPGVEDGTRIRLETHDAHECHQRDEPAPFFSVDRRKLENDLGLTGEEFAAATMLLLNQGLLPGRGEGVVGMVGLSERGQAEAERLGPHVPLREPVHQQAVHINAAYSIVQVGGTGSVQTASLHLDGSEIEKNSSKR